MTATTGRELTAQLNREFGLDWNEHAYWVRARKAGYRWPGGTLPRLTPEQSRQLDECLRELCAALMPGTEIRKTLNAKFGIGLKLAAYFARVTRLGLPWTKTIKTGRAPSGAEYLSKDQRGACYEDPAYEARQGITDHVICRECFQKLRDGAMHSTRGHLWTRHDRMTLQRYRQRNPGARIFTLQRMADEAGRDVLEYAAEEAGQYVTPKQRAAADLDRKYEVHNGMPRYVICRILRCGFKSVGRLDKHLESQHGVKDVDAYRLEHNWAPIHSRDYLTERAERQQVKLAEAKADLAEAKRRKILRGKPLWMQVGGNFLFDNPSAGNLEILAYLDKMRVPRRDKELWAAVSNRPSLKNDLSDLRGLVGIRGRTFGQKL